MATSYRIDTIERYPASANSLIVKNPFKVGDKVLTKVRGAEVEGVVTKLWQNEIQVRTPDNELRWRTVYTVWYPGGSPLQRPGKAGSNASKPVASDQPKKAGRAKTKASGKRPQKRH